MSTTSAQLPEPLWLTCVFDRILCGLDGSEFSRVAARQASRLLPARRVLQLLTVVEGPPAATQTSAVPAEIEQRYENARRTLSAARATCPQAQERVLFGDPAPAIVGAARELDATLVAVGGPHRSRLGDVVLGAVATHLLHDAPCSVLVARPAPDEAAFPRSIAVGHDGSRGAADAVAVAKELAHRFSAELRILAATGGAPVRPERLAAEPLLEWSSLAPVETLTAASDEVDLVVVGSRGLPGLRSLGSVSERVGHLARSSVLVVREPAAVVAERDAVPDDEC